MGIEVSDLITVPKDYGHSNIYIIPDFTQHQVHAFAFDSFASTSKKYIISHEHGRYHSWRGGKIV
jgi:hypothetical protein